MAIADVKVPACRPVGFTVTIRVLGSVPEEGDTVSQFPPLLVTGVAVNDVPVPVVDTVTSCVTGAVLLAGKTKLSDVGLVEIGLMPPAELGLNTTGTERNEPDALMLINPTSVSVGGVAPIPTDRMTGVVPLVGVTSSQFVSENADTVIACAVPDVICTSWFTAVPLKRSWGGLAVSVLFCALAVPRRNAKAGSKTARRNNGVWVVFTIFS